MNWEISATQNQEAEKIRATLQLKKRKKRNWQAAQSYLELREKYWRQLTNISKYDFIVFGYLPTQRLEEVNFKIGHPYTQRRN